MPVDGGVVPFAQTLLPHAARTQGMIDGGGDVGTEHAEEIQRHSCRGPRVLVADAEYEKGDAYAYAHQDAAEMRP